MIRWIQNFLLAFSVCFIAAVIFPVFGRTPRTDCGPSCQSHLKQIGLGFAQYEQDYDERMPGVRTGGGWAHVLYPYVKSDQVFQCPRETSPPQTKPDPNSTGYTDYYYNSQLQKRNLGEIEDNSKIILAADGNDSQDMTDASYSKPWLPYSWRTDTSSPAFRHVGMANYLFVDGTLQL